MNILFLGIVHHKNFTLMVKLLLPLLHKKFYSFFLRKLKIKILTEKNVKKKHQYMYQGKKKIERAPTILCFQIVILYINKKNIVTYYISKILVFAKYFRRVLAYNRCLAMDICICMCIESNFVFLFKSIYFS